VRPPEYDIVIPTIGRPALNRLLESLAQAQGPKPQRVIVVHDDERRGPAATRNEGWLQSTAPWVVFLDDDVVVNDTWCDDLARDLAAADGSAATQGCIVVPLTEARPPTDWERNVKALENAHWITADCAYRREALERVGGFDSRFPRAYREDADLALRLMDAGFRLTRGSRTTVHPVRPADAWISVRLQAGNADDALMTHLHGTDWRERVSAPRGAFARHCVTVAFAATAALSFALWAASTLAFAWKRIAPGPRDAREVHAMLLTSVAIPFAAVYYRWRGAR
jgi:cellulose synthase/poly-beta-1,6-N-acetylglucosamine synthase-like glycosyltransferase